jgi:hypothetical protein
MASILPFRDPSLPLTGVERLAARRVYRASCKAIAAKAVTQAFSEANKTPGCGKLSVEDALPVFVAAMRRELRRTELF